MAAFEHVMVLMSFVLALALTHLLTTIIALIRARDRVRLSWIHLGWMVFGLFITVGWWVGMWDFHVVSHWTTLNIWISLIAVVTTYLYIGLVCPKVLDVGTIDLVEFHDRHRHEYLSAGIVSGVMGAVVALYFQYWYQVPGQTLQVIIIGALVISTTAGLVSPNKWVQRISPILANAGWVLFFLIGDPALT